MITEIEAMQEQVQQKWLVFYLSLGIGLFMLSIAWHQGLFKPFQRSSFPVIRGKDVLKGFGFFLFIQLLFIPGFIIFILMMTIEKDFQAISFQMKGWMNLLTILGGFIGAFIAYFGLTPIQRQQIWKQTDEPWYIHLGIGIATWFFCYPLVLAFYEGFSLVLWYVFHYSVIEQSSLQNLRKTISNPFLYSLTSLALITLVPLTEEFLFRGLLQSWLKRKFHSSFTPIILSSLVFAFFHYSNSQGMTNLTLISSLFLLSFVLGYLYERQRSLWASVGLHSFFNFMSLVLLFQEPNVI